MPRVLISNCVKKRKDYRNRFTQKYLAAFQRLTASLEANGQQEAIKVVPIGSDELEVVDGWTRVLGLRLLGKKEVEVVELPSDLSETDLGVHEWMGNNAGEEFDLLAQAELFLGIMKREGWTAAEMCERYPIFRPSSVSKALSVFENLIDELKARVTELGGRKAYAFSRLPRDHQPTKFQEWGGKKVEIIEQRVSEFLGKKPKTKVKPQTVKHEGVTVTFAADLNRDQVLEACKLAVKKIA